MFNTIFHSALPSGKNFEEELVTADSDDEFYLEMSQLAQMWIRSKLSTNLYHYAFLFGLVLLNSRVFVNLTIRWQIVCFMDSMV